MHRGKTDCYSISSSVATSDGGEAPSCSGAGWVGSAFHHQAGRDGDSEHLSDARIVKAVRHFGDGPDHAMLAGACVRGGLEWSGIARSKAKQCDDGSDQSLGLTQCQAEHGPQRQGGRYCQT